MLKRRKDGVWLDGAVDVSGAALQVRYNGNWIATAGAAVSDTLNMYVGQSPQTLDVLANDDGLDTITGAAITSGGDGTSSVSHDGSVLTITPRVSKGTIRGTYTATGPGGATWEGSWTARVYNALVATGLTELTAVESESQDWYGFTTFDEDADELIQGIFDFDDELNPVLIKDSGDNRINVVNNRPVANDSNGGFVATAIFSATDAIGQAAGPVEVTFTVSEKLVVNIVNAVPRSIETVGDEIIESTYDGPGTTYDGAYPIDPTLVKNAPPRLRSPLALPKIVNGMGHYGFWFNDELSGGVMSLAYEWLDASDEVIEDGVIDVDDGLLPQPGSTAVIFKVIATDANGSTVARSDNTDNVAPSFFAQTLTIPVNAGESAAPNLETQTLTIEVEPAA